MSSGPVARVLFLCVHNAGRSQMAAAILCAESAATGPSCTRPGSDPGDTLNPAVVAALARMGHRHLGGATEELTDDMARRADVIVTMGCGDACPVYPGKRYVDWELPDPAGRPMEEVRPIRDEIAGRVDALVTELGAGRRRPDRE